MEISISLSEYLNDTAKQEEREKAALQNNATNTKLKLAAGIEAILDPSNVYESHHDLMNISVVKEFFISQILDKSYARMKLYPFIESIESEFTIIKLVNPDGWEVSYVPTHISLEIAHFINQNNTTYPIFYLVEDESVDIYRKIKMQFRLEEWDSREKLNKELEQVSFHWEKRKEYIKVKEENNNILFKIFNKARGLARPYEAIAIYQKILEEGMPPVSYVDNITIHHKLHMIYLELGEYELAISEAEKILENLESKRSVSISSIELAQRRIVKTIAKMNKRKNINTTPYPSLAEQIEYKKRAEQTFWNHNYKRICSYEDFIVNKNEKTIESENRSSSTIQNTNPKDFIALDFETANARRTSACAIGLAFVRDGKIARTEHYYIKPTPNYHDSRITQIHGITAKDTADKPTFIELWNSTLKDKLLGELIVCHNASFDMSVLRALMCEFNICTDRIDYLCTLVLSKAHIGGLYDYKLPTVNRHLGYNTFKHHDAAADAEAAAYIFIEICKQLNCDNYRQLSDHININCGSIYDYESYAPCSGARLQYSRKLNLSDSSDSNTFSPERSTPEIKAITIEQKAEIKDVLKPNFEAVDDSTNPFFKKKIVVTGTFINFPDRIELQKQLKLLGADINTSVSAKTDLVIFGQSPGWSKMSKVEKYNITTISEPQLMNSYQQYLR